MVMQGQAVIVITIIPATWEEMEAEVPEADQLLVVELQEAEVYLLPEVRMEEMLEELVAHPAMTDMVAAAAAVQVAPEKQGMANPEEMVVLVVMPALVVPVVLVVEVEVEVPAVVQIAIEMAEKEQTDQMELMELMHQLRRLQMQIYIAILFYQMVSLPVAQMEKAVAVDKAAVPELDKAVRFV
jgi:hypothetical protein